MRYKCSNSQHIDLYTIFLWIRTVQWKILYKQTISFRVHTFSINLKTLFDFGSYLCASSSYRLDTKATKKRDVLHARIVDMFKMYIFRHRPPVHCSSQTVVFGCLVPLVLDFYSIFRYYFSSFGNFFVFFFFDSVYCAFDINKTTICVGDVSLYRVIRIEFYFYLALEWNLTNAKRLWHTHTHTQVSQCTYIYFIANLKYLHKIKVKSRQIGEPKMEKKIRRNNK